MEIIIYILSLIAVSLGSFIANYIAKKLKISPIPIILIVGIILGHLKLNNDYLIKVPEIFISTVASLGLIFILFKSSTHLNLKELTSLYPKSIKNAFISFLANTTILSIIFYYLMPAKSVLMSILFSVVISGVAFSENFRTHYDKKYHVMESLYSEYIISTPILIVISLIIFELLSINASHNNIGIIFSDLNIFFKPIILGIGIGFLTGMILFKIYNLQKTHKNKHDLMSPLLIFALATFIFLFTEKLGGNAVLATFVFGAILGNVFFRKKNFFKSHSSSISSFFETAIIIQLGLISKLLPSPNLIIKTFILFLIYLLIRYFTISFVFSKKMDLKHRFFLTIAPLKGKGEAVIATFIILFGAQIYYSTELASIIILFMLFSNITSSYAEEKIHFFLNDYK